MRPFLIRLPDADYEVLKKLSYAERLPRAEIIRRLIRLEAFHKREEERRQASHQQSALETAKLQKRG